MDDAGTTIPGSDAGEPPGGRTPVPELFRRAEALRRDGQLRAAAKVYSEIIQRHPGFVPAYSRLGVMLASQGKYAAAERCFRRALSIRPEAADADLHYNLGFVLQREHRPDEATDCYRAALALNPHHVPALNNLGNNLMRSGELREAELCYRKVLAIQPGKEGARHNLGHLQLLQGNWTEGWSNFEHRLNARGSQAKWRGLPDRSLVWKGEPLAGGKLLVWSELGFGDTLQFVRYTKHLVEQGVNVTLAVQAPLVELMRNAIAWKVEVIDRTNLPAQRWNRHVSVMSLPGIMDPTLEKFTWREPYLRVTSRNSRAHWGLPAAGTLVGIVWASGASHPRLKPFKSTGPERLVDALLQVPGITLVALQFDEEAEQIAPLLQPRVIMPRLRTRSFLESAELLNELDAVVSVDTAMAHLAGALGRPVWTLLMYIADWRWRLDAVDTCWYPTMRLARQRRPDDWQGALDFLVRDLQRALNAVPSPSP